MCTIKMMRSDGAPKKLLLNVSRSCFVHGCRRRLIPFSVKQYPCLMKQTLQRRQPLKMSGHADREARAKELVTLFVKFLGDHVDLIVQVRRDFLVKPKTETIMGCHTFGEYC